MVAENRISGFPGNENDSSSTLRESFERVYGVPLEEIEREWIDLLDGG